MNKNRLKQLRQERKLTLRELAEKVNISFPNLNAMENGKIGISNENIDTFCDFYNVSADYLLGRSNYRYTNDKSNISFALGGLEDELTDKDKEMILNLAQSLADKNKDE